MNLAATFPKMNKGLVMFTDKSAEQNLRTLHAGIEPDKQTGSRKLLMICRIAYNATGSRPKFGPEIEGGYRIFLGEQGA